MNLKAGIVLFAVLLIFCCFAYQRWTEVSAPISVLVFSKTEGFRHESITAGKQMFLKMAQEKGFKVDTTEDARYFEEEQLSNYNVVVWLNTTGDVLNEQQERTFNNYIKQGGAYLGIHSAADTEYDWSWYGDLVGAYFKNHPNDPNVRTAVIDKVDKAHFCTQHLPDSFNRTDEWYNYKVIREHINVLLTLDETSYEGGENGVEHPITWYHERQGGRAFYTGFGHTPETFSEKPFQEMIWRAIQWTSKGAKP